MAEQRLDGMRVAILVSNYFEQVELTEPRKALEQAGAQTQLVAPKPGEVQGMNHVDKADRFPVDLTLDQADPDQFDAVLLPGGVVNADALRMEPKAQEFVKKIQQAGKPLAVICHGPWLLVSSGLVKDRTLTSYYTLQDDIRNAGGRWEDREVVRDRNWVSSRWPRDIPAFNREMLALLAEWRARRAPRGGESGAAPARARHSTRRATGPPDHGAKSRRRAARQYRVPRAWTWRTAPVLPRPGARLVYSGPRASQRSKA